MRALEKPYPSLRNMLFNRNVKGSLSLFCNRRRMAIASAIWGLFVTLAGGLCSEIQAQTVVFQSTIGSGFGGPQGVGADALGNVYVVDTPVASGSVQRIVKITATGTQTTLVSNAAVPSGNLTEGLAVDPAGNVYFATGSLSQAGDLMEVSSSGTVTDLSCPTPSVPSSSCFHVSNGDTVLALDSSGNIYESSGAGVVKIPPTDRTCATASHCPVTFIGISIGGIAVDSSGNLYVSDNTDNLVLKMTPSGMQSTVPISGLNDPFGIAFDGSGNLYVADSTNHRVVKMTSEGIQTTVPISGLNFPVAVATDGSGNLYVSDLGDKLVFRVEAGAQAGALNFGSIAAGSTSTTQTITASFTAPATLSATSPLQVVTFGAANLDFKSSGTTCTASVYAAGDTCTIAIAFSPTAAGPRYGALVLQDPNGNVLGTANFYGVGVGPQIAYDPGTTTSSITTIGGTAIGSPESVAVDGAGNVYVADVGKQHVVKIPATDLTCANPSDCPFVGAAITGASAPSIGTAGPYGMAVDGAGNVYTSVAGSLSSIIQITPNGTETNLAGSGTYGDPEGVAVDGSGDVFIADEVKNQVVEVTAAGVQSIIGSGLTKPEFVAVDGAGNVYVSEYFSNQVVKVAPGGAQSNIGSGLSGPSGLAVDGSGSVYVADTLNNRIVRVSASGVQNTVVSGLNTPRGIALDGNGNLYVANVGTNSVLRVNRSASPNLTFASTQPGSTSSDSPQFVVVDNIGNAALNFTVPNSGNNASISPNFNLGNSTTCPELSSSSNAASLSSGSSCEYVINFTPQTSGSINGALVLSDNALNAINPYATQSIALSGTGTGQAQAPTATLSVTNLTFASQTQNVISAAQTITLTNSGTAALTITSIAASGDFAQTDTCGMSVAAGAKCTISVTFTPTAAGVRTGTLTIADNASGSPQTITLSGTGAVAVITSSAVTLSPTSLTFASQVDSIASAAQTVTLTNSGTAGLIISSIATTGDFAQTNTCGTSVTAGASCAISVTFTPTAAGNRTGTLTITDNASGSPQAVALSGGGETVSVTSSSTGLTIASAGGSATATIQLSPQDGFTGTVNLTCAVSYQGQGTPNSPPTCSLSPSQAQVTGTSSVSSTLTVSTTAASATAALDRQWKGTGFALAALIFLGILPRRRWRGGLLAAALCLIVIGGVIGCSGSNGGGTNSTPPSPSGTTTGNYQVMVTATSGTATASTTIPLSLQ
jgi:sugar lactone lactonase YvrE